MLTSPSICILPEATARRPATSATTSAIRVSTSEMPPAQIGAQKKPPLCSQNSRLSSSLNLWVACGATRAGRGRSSSIVIA